MLSSPLQLHVLFASLTECKLQEERNHIYLIHGCIPDAVHDTESVFSKCLGHKKNLFKGIGTNLILYPVRADIKNLYNLSHNMNVLMLLKCMLKMVNFIFCMFYHNKEKSLQFRWSLVTLATTVN